MPTITHLGDNALLLTITDSISVKASALIRKLTCYIEKNGIKGVIELVPAYTGLTIFYDPCILTFKEISVHLEDVLKKSKNEKLPPSTEIVIPTCYGGNFGPDLEYVANHNNLSPEQVIKFHSKRKYLVYMLGFSPGFPYLGGMDERIACPRLTSPRLKVEAGSVGIGGKQTGIYSMDTPGGWQIIGRTPVKLFDINNEKPFLIDQGDTLTFKPITEKEFFDLYGENKNA